MKWLLLFLLLYPCITAWMWWCLRNPDASRDERTR